MSAVSVVVTTVRCDGPGCRAVEQDEAARTRLRARLARQGWIRRNSPAGDTQLDLCPTCGPKSAPVPARAGTAGRRHPPTTHREDHEMTTTDHDTAAVLTEAEWRDLRQAHERDAWAREWNSLPTAVDRVVARLAAQPPQDDPQPDERMAAHTPAAAGPAYILCRCDMVRRDVPAYRRHLMKIFTSTAIAAPEPDNDLRERVEALTFEVDRRTRMDEDGAPYDDYGLGRQHAMSELRAALAEPTPGSES